MSDKTKAREILEELEASGLEDRDVAIHKLHCAMMALTGEASELDAPIRAKRETPKKSTPDPDSRPAPSGPRPNDSVVARDERIDGPVAGAKDARLAEDSRIEDARNAVGGEDEAAEREAETRRKIKADKKLAKSHGVEAGDAHPEDRGMDGAVSTKPKKAKKTR